LTSTAVLTRTEEPLNIPSVARYFPDAATLAAVDSAVLELCFCRRVGEQIFVLSHW
jgi:hypothetical protein